MIKPASRVALVLACAVLTLSFHGSLRAADEYTSTFLQGSDIYGNVLSVEDGQYWLMNSYCNSPTTWPFVNVKSTAGILLAFENDDNIYYSGPWEVAVELTILKYDVCGNQFTDTLTLFLYFDNDNGQVNNSRSLFLIEGYLKTDIQVNNVSVSGSISTIPDNVRLEAFVQVERYWELDPDLEVDGLGDLGVDTNENTLTVFWDVFYGAEEYDLEWVFISDDQSPMITFPEDEDWSRAVRVSTPENQYKITIAYDDGVIFYRVRPCGRIRENTNQRFEGPWTGFTGNVSVTNLNADLNWTFQESFAEGGKSKAVVNFFDGSLRSRQQVTRLSTDNVALFSQTIYDYEGRPALNTLPAPDQGRTAKIGYLEQFALSPQGSAVYSRLDFDNSSNYSTSNCAVNHIPPMNDGQGPANYYSPNNPYVSDEFFGLIPDAKGFPFTLTLYDNRGRVSSEGGPGIDHITGSGHETRYMYSTPTQEALLSLFGNDVGDAKHYKRTVIVDANGQQSVSYENILTGKVVATSLLGSSPLSLSALNSQVGTTFSGDYNELGTWDPVNKVHFTDVVIQTYEPGQSYSFSYSVNPGSLTELCTNEEFGCVYEVIITVNDECGNSLGDYECPQGVLGTLYSLSSVNNGVPDFEITFPEAGVYTMRKELRISANALDSAVIDYQVLLPGTCFDELNEMKDTFSSVIIDGECDCQAYCEQWADELGYNSVSECLAGECPDQISTLSSCDALYATLLKDMSPGGQYFENLPNENSSNYVWHEWLDFKNLDPPNSTLYPYSQTINSWADVKQYWQDTWAVNLVFYHPEYCHWVTCEKLLPSTQFDIELFESTWERVTNYPPDGPYIYYQNNTVDVTGLVTQHDPFFDENSVMWNNYTCKQTLLSTFYSMMMSELTDNYSLIPGTGNINMWEYAINDSNSYEEAWLIFRSLYIGMKRNYIDIYTQHSACMECPFLVDDGILPYTTTPAGFEIRCPSYINQIDHIQDSIAATQVADSIGYYLNTCSKSAEMEFSTFTVEQNCSCSVNVQVDDGSDTVDIIATPIDYATGLLTSQELASVIVLSINQYISYPDYTAYIDPNDSRLVHVVASVGLGASANGFELIISTGLCTNLVTNLNPYFSGGESDLPCDSLAGEYTFKHCLCDVLYDLSASLDNPYDFEAIADLINTYYGYPSPPYLVTPDDINKWMIYCEESDLVSPFPLDEDGFIDTDHEEYVPLPPELACDPDPCDQSVVAYADFFAEELYKQKVNFYTDNFIEDYINACFNPAEFSENFTYSFTSKEYHYTLYYYDRSGNLVQTVPPAGVRPLTQAEIANAKNHASNPLVYPNPVLPGHNLTTTYAYNSLGQVIGQTMPDHDGATRFWYDPIGRLLASQNPEQEQYDKYSYTLYDNLSRPVETGEVTNTTTLSANALVSMQTFTSWLAYGTKNQVVTTEYDQVTNPISGFDQLNLRGRIASITLNCDGSGAYDHASHYSYDIHGNVSALWQDIPALSAYGNQYKRIEHQYDLVSGNVNRVDYQSSNIDAFHHYYTYDADNRIITASTSDNGFVWDIDADYQYYLHGPLARTELGFLKVQGLDYYYSIQGWIKGVNSTTLDPYRDPGVDGEDVTSGSSHCSHARDAFAYSLEYFFEDYIPIGTFSSNTAFLATDIWGSGSTSSGQLFNGNISKMATTLKNSDPNNQNYSLFQPLEQLYEYNYDQLNRIVGMQGYSNASFASTNSWANSTPTYQSEYSYDPNGNLLSLKRSDAGLNSMDDLTYQYDWVDPNDILQGINSNRLYHVNDDVAPGDFLIDIDDQGAFNPSNIPATNNYRYDKIGNLIMDIAEEISAITWNVFGKIVSITRSQGSVKPDLEFLYDALGNRMAKIVKPKDANGDLMSQQYWETTWYVRDAQGNIMAVYYLADVEEFEGMELYLQEHHIYGSARLGMQTMNRRVNNVENPRVLKREHGFKFYELTNHLGNVLTTISAHKIGIPDQSNTAIAYYESDIRSYHDYYPFGMGMPGRSYEATDYRFGFNGKEADPEAVAAGSQYDYGFRIYNTGLARFLSVDPLTASYPWYTPYQFAGNKPINSIDLDGLEEWMVVSYFRDGKYLGEAIFRIKEESRIPKTTGSSEKYNGVVYVNYNLGQQEKFDHLQVYPLNWRNRIRNSNTTHSFSDDLNARQQAMLEGLTLSYPDLFNKLMEFESFAKYTEPIPENIQFESNSYDLNAESIAELENLAKKMNTFLDSKYSIEAHTDNVGSDIDNQKLSEARAKACFDYLTTELGIDPSRLSAFGHGANKPIATNETEEGRAQNRRVEFIETERGY